MFSVGDCITNNPFKENLEDTTGLSSSSMTVHRGDVGRNLFVNETGDPLDATSTG